ncbi:hypothetical protein FQA39_LY15790 [Lamprigera yunnana]|nr:hypothetical protein FQA39_LY15790 [Lamprigera yunnana]
MYKYKTTYETSDDNNIDNSNNQFLLTLEKEISPTTLDQYRQADMERKENKNQNPNIIIEVVNIREENSPNEIEIENLNITIDEDSFHVMAIK